MQTIGNYTLEEEQQIVKSATKRKELKRLDQILKEKHFRIRNSSIQHYFLRMSCGHKKDFIIRLMETITGLPNIWQILNVMSLESTKLINYSQVDPETNFIHDKLILDHDRMLDEKALAETMDNDVAWFVTLPDNLQISLIIDLIRMSSGVVKRTLYMKIFRIFRKALAEYRKLQCETPTQENLDNTSNILKDTILEEEDEYDPKHPATIEVERQTSKWDEMMSKYRLEVQQACVNYSAKAKRGDNTEKKDEKTKKKDEKTKKKDEKTKKKDEKTKKDKKSKKKEGTVTTKTKSDNSKKTKSGKKGKNEGIDMIQLMPIWIVKKICGYLDQKSLMSMKYTNRYFSYVVQDILKERKVREKINKYLEDLEAQIDPEKLKSAIASSDKPPNKATKRTHGIYYEMGAISKNLVPTQKKNLVDTCLESEAPKEFDDEFALPTGELISFPRLIEKDIQLYRHLPGFLQDINVIYDVEGDIQRQRSFLTYSLTSVMSTLKILVNEQDLSDW